MILRIENFRDLKTTRRPFSAIEHIAKVDVTRGFLWWQRTDEAIIKNDGGSWYFVDSGEFTPGYLVENLERAYKAKKSLEDLNDKVI